MMRILSVALAAGFLFAISSGAVCQQPPKPAEEKPKPAKKAKKVWTEDDLKAVRKPWDEHADQKVAAAEQEARAKQRPTEQKEAAVKEEKTAEKKNAEENLAAESSFERPKTVEEAEDRIRQKREGIQSETDKIQQFRQEYLNQTNEDLRKDLGELINKLASDLKRAEAELALLEKALEELKAKVPRGATPQPASPPPC